MLENQQIEKQVMEIMDTLLEAAEELIKLAVNKDYIGFENMSKDIIDALEAIYKVALERKIEKPEVTTDLACISIADSMKNILKLSYSRSDKVFSKIEFELIPLMHEMKLNFYYWSCVFPDKKLISHYYKNEMIPLSSNRYIDEAEKTGKYKYDLSIVILGYNKLEYTKMCVQSLLMYVPKKINYELILINHGSTDGTKEYFESITPTKQLDISKNGGGLLSVYRILEGRYSLFISNDVLVTENAIENMMKCMDSDEKIIKIVPSTPNISNYQTIIDSYSNIGEMYEFAKKNNISDPFRWEQRCRLCDPISMLRSSLCFGSNGIGIGRFYTSSNVQSFPDDNASLLIRRNGYKMILAKDAYCYHFGSVTLKEEIEKENNELSKKSKHNFYDQGRKEFFNTFGIDPWGVGFCWDLDLFEKLSCNENGNIDILGINCGIGSNILKVKELIKENSHNFDTKIYNVTEAECYIEDLKGISDYVEFIKDCSTIKEKFKEKKFKYIIFESGLEKYENYLEIVTDIKKMLCEDGILAIKMEDKNLQNNIKATYNTIKANKWLILK